MPRRDCTDCAGVIRKTGEHASLACLDQWRVLDALDRLDDDAERKEINQALAAAITLISAMVTAADDGATTRAELAELKVLGQKLLQEINDIVRYDEHENLQHERATTAEADAREHSAVVSHALDDALTRIDDRRAGGVGQGHLWAPQRTRELTVA